MSVERSETIPLYYRLFKSFLRGSYEGSINAHKLNLVDSECIFKFTQQVVLHAAETGNCVMVGRGSQYFPQQPPGHATRVSLCSERGQSCGGCLLRGKNETEAQELVDTVDRERGDFIEKYFNAEWPNRSLYHAMINTSIGDETVVQTIVDFLKTFDSKLTTV